MSTSRVTVGWPALVAGGIALLAAGAGIAYVAVRPASPSHAVQPSVGAPSSISTPAPSAASEVVITLTPEAIQRAGIVLVPVSAGRDTSALRLPGVVQPNAYKQIVITPVVAGRVTRVLAEL